MRSAFVVLALVGSLAPAHAGKRTTFESLSVEVPARWTVAKAREALTLQATDAASGAFALVVVTRATASRGDAAADFRAGWQETIAGTFGVAAAPTPQGAAAEAGWTATSGSAIGTVGGRPATVILIAMTGHGRAMNVVIASNSDAFAGPLEALVGSIKMKAPKGAPPPAAADAPPAAPAATPPATAPPGGRPTTTFDDGWTATAEGAWVRVSRADATAFLHPPTPLDDASRADVVGAFWDRLVAPRYTVTKLHRREYSAVHFPYYYRLADAVERATGRKVFVALRVITANGTATPIEVVAASEAALTARFPTLEAIAAITGANRFAIGAELAGTWSGADSAAIDMVYASSGNYAGMNVASLSDTFTFGADGRYQSTHTGASGMVGSIQAFKEKVTGTYATAPWEITVRKADGSKTVYAAWYEMIRDRRVLHLQDKQHAGMSYALVRK